MISNIEEVEDEVVPQDDRIYLDWWALAEPSKFTLDDMDLEFASANDYALV